MGEVYLGEKIGPEGFVKPVVLKCVLPQLARDRAFVQLFLDEARLAALLNHPNIAQVYDFGLVDDVYYIAMEYVPGYTVDDIRRKLRSINVHLPLEHVASIASQVCQGLHYAHTLTDANGVGLGLVHRDVSPHNLIVSIDGGVKIVDFGIAKARAGLTRVQAKGAVGKFGYMSPEQSRGEVVDGRSDLFSLGVCLWELATNERLHDPKLDRAPDYNPRNPVQNISERRRDVPRQFEQILETALSIQAEDRFGNAQEMHLATERFLAAMTHYAGHAALAKYIKDLVEGKVESSGGVGVGLLEPGPKGVSPTRPVSRNTAPEALEGAQKYEEVFGVTMDAKKRARPVPKSWETKKAPEEQPKTPSQPAGPRLLDLKSEKARALEPDLELDLGDSAQVRRSVPARPAMAPERAKPSSSVPIFLIASFLLVAGAGAAAYFYQDQIMALVRPKEVVAPKLTSVYRVISDPPGATVYVDEQAKEGVTPLELELIPDIEYAIAVKLPKFASKTAVVRASVGTEVRPIQFKLDPAATLTVTSDPPGAALWVDGKLLANLVTPATLDDVTAGRELKITAEVKGRPAQTKTVSIQPGKKKTLKFALEMDELERQKQAPSPEPESLDR
jgi:serine/threonine-protein kinase